MPARKMREARMSNEPGFFKRTSGRTKMPAPSAIAMSGTLTRKAACQLKCSSRKPPMSGPVAMPSAPMADHAATANARSFAS